MFNALVFVAIAYWIAPVAANQEVSDLLCRDDWGSFCTLEPEACYYIKGRKEVCRRTCGQCGIRDEGNDEPRKELKANQEVSDPLCRDDWGSLCTLEPEACYYLKGRKEVCRLTCKQCGIRDEVNDEPRKELKDEAVLGHNTFIFGLLEITVKRNNFISRVPYIGREFEISFDIFSTWFNSGWHSVIHFSTSNRNSAVRGDRIPAIWFTRGNAAANKHKMLVCSDINGNKDLCHTTRNIIQGHKWTSIIINQESVFGGYYFGITIDGHKIYTQRNDRAASYKDVWVYAADPWYTNQQSQIKNLIIKTSL